MWCREGEKERIINDPGGQMKSTRGVREARRNERNDVVER